MLIELQEHEPSEGERCGNPEEDGDSEEQVVGVCREIGLAGVHADFLEATGAGQRMVGQDASCSFGELEPEVGVAAAWGGEDGRDPFSDRSSGDEGEKRRAGDRDCAGNEQRKTRPTVDEVDGRADEKRDP